MASIPESFKTYGFSYEEQMARARWHKEDLEKGGWKVAHKDERKTFWTKSFPGEEIPSRAVYEYKMPLSAEQFSEVFSPRNMNERLKWDKAWIDNAVLEECPGNGGHVTTCTAKLKWPLKDREFVLFFPPDKEIDWYGKRAIYNGCVNATHPSRPANAAGRVRVLNGGNIYIAIPDEKDPENACTVFGMASNDYCGSIPKSVMSRLVARRLPQTIGLFFDSLIDGYHNYVAPKKETKSEDDGS